MTVDSNFQGFILSNKSSVPSALLLSLQILTGNLCCSSQGKNFKANEHQRSSERGRTGSFHIRLSYVKKKKKKLFYLWMDGTYSSLHSCLLYIVLQLAWACMFSEWEMSCPVMSAPFLLKKKNQHQCSLTELWFSEQWFSTFSCFAAHCTLAISNRMKIFIVVETG